MKTRLVGQELSETAAVCFPINISFMDVDRRGVQSHNTYFGLLCLAPVRLSCETPLASFAVLMVVVSGNVMQMICMDGLLDVFGPGCDVSPVIWSDTTAS